MNPEKRRKQILNCAKKLFSKNGYHNTQIADIVQSSKIARGTIYNYFKNKDDIFITLLGDYCQEWEDSLARDSLDLDTISPQAFLRSKIRNTLKFFANDRYLTNIILRVGIGLSGGLDFSIKRFEEIILNVINEYLALGIRAGNIRPEMNLEVTSNLICGALLRSAFFYFGPERKKHTIEINELTEEITDVIANGIFIK